MNDPVGELPVDWFQQLDADVQGWCTQESAALLWRLAGLNLGLRAIVEIGSAWGKSTIVLAEASRRAGGGPVHSVDPHTGGIGYIKQLGVDRIDSFPVFASNVARYGLTAQVIPMVATSERAAAQWHPGQPVRLLYIDGLHTAAGVTTDIQQWIPFVARDGLIVFDDYHQPSVPDYRAKIDELLPGFSVVLPLVNAPGGLVYTRKIT